MEHSQKLIILGILVGAVGIGIGVIIGYFSRGETYAPVEPPTADSEASKMILNEILPNNIEENLRALTAKPHIAGREVEEDELVNFIAESWKNAGLSVEIHPYDVLLSYPDQTDSNYVEIKNADGTSVDRSNPTEAILDESQNKTGVVNPFNAYSASGDAEGEIVYVNYGTIEDFTFINQTIDLNGKICISRHGKIFRGDKALHAEQFNCAGLILYSDPMDYAVEGEEVYPDGLFLPGTGVQRGALFKGEGDPLTVHYPSIDTAWRIAEEKAPLPKIPVTPIGYDDAKMYLEKMGGAEVKDEWKGNLNITYKYGSGFTGDFISSKMRMHVTTQNEVKTTRNIIGYIRGFVEPDRYVIIGNHRDAWVFGAMDPSSGTAVMLEMSRSFGLAVKNGWRPRRSIVFCSWGAEEYALIGSTEWVEEFQKVLGSRTIAYLNIDTAVTGDYSLYAGGSSILRNLVFEASKIVPNPNIAEVDADRTTTYDTWTYVNGNDQPPFQTLGAGSDYTMFLQLTGIASATFQYEFNPNYGVRGYPVYHSVYETFDYVKKFIDPDFKYHQALGRVVAEIGRSLADSPLLPLNAVDYAGKMKDDMLFMLSIFAQNLTSNGIDTKLLTSAMDNFTTATRDFHYRLKNLDLTDTLALRAANDQLMNLEQAFIDKQGIEGRVEFSHVIYAPSLHNTYGGSAFPGLVDSMFEISSDPDQESRWDEVKRQYSILLYHLGSAASTLRDVVPIKGYSNQ